MKGKGLTMKKMTVLAAICACAGASFGTAASANAFGEVRLTGRLGETFERMLRNHVEATDPVYLASAFRTRTEAWQWQSEFWGKYMHAAVPLSAYAPDGGLKARIAAGVEAILATQDGEGYIGNYSPERRFAYNTWDVWGVKYTLMGLMFQYDAIKDERILKAACRLCDYLISKVGPGNAVTIAGTGAYAGCASCSVLEPVVWLYRRTHEKRYLDFAGFIVREMTERENGPRLLDLAQKGVPVSRRSVLAKDVTSIWQGSGTSRGKAYEMMSCYQGLLDYSLETGRRDLVEAAVKTAEDIVRNELFITGSGASYEHWFGGAERQVRAYPHVQETCVTITWMRLCEKLLAMTGEARWADEFERTFHNAYLAALSPAGDRFTAYTPLTGSRSGGRRHCHMRANCCDANGPRGFVSFLESMMTARAGGAVRLNWYASALTDLFEIDTPYPRTGFVLLRYLGNEPRRFRLEPRLPAWCRKVTATINGEDLAVAAEKGWIGIDREWRPGDVLTLDFAMEVVRHRRGDFVAFTRGPLVLVRDTRFNDGDLSVPLRRSVLAADVAADFRPVMTPDPSFRVTLEAVLPFDDHNNTVDATLPVPVRFCDYASGAGLWCADNVCRTWFEVQGDTVEALKE